MTRNELNPCADCPNAERRRFLTKLSLVLGGIGAALASIPSIGFLLGL